MESERRGKVTMTQVSLGGFERDVTAKEVASYLEDEIGDVWRCRLKFSSTPLESYPTFEVTDASRIQTTDDYEKVEPHAFVHFAAPVSARCAVEASGHCGMFFKGKALKVIPGFENQHRIDLRRAITPYKFHDVLVEIGVLVSQDEFFVGWRGPPKGVNFLVDPFDGTCKFIFTRDTAFSLKDTASYVVMKCIYKVEFLVRDINEIRRFQDSSSLILLLQLASSPFVSYRTADDDAEESVPFELLDDDDPWIRTTDFTPSGAIGRCNSYRISIHPRHGIKLDKSLNFFIERRIPVNKPKRQLRVRNEPDYDIRMRDSFFNIQYQEGITFGILFMLNAVLHKGIINQHQLSENFYNLLRSQPVDVNIAALRRIYLYKRPVFDAYKRLKLVQNWLLTNPKFFKNPKPLDNIVEVRRLVITPAKAYCMPPEVELSNRVLRNYKEVSDRFLRVTFMDEGMQTLNTNAFRYYAAAIVKEITENSHPQKTKLFQRVKNILIDGFSLCGRKYSFLAFSTNQLKDRSAWFFADDKKINVMNIKSWMGKFTNKNVAKCAARMGLCFSSTYATVEVPLDDVDTQYPDVERGKYVFSDGIGMITPDLALEVAKKLKLDSSPPCAYQIRYAGCKGVVACWPGISDKRMYLRPSMEKFISSHTTLEVCSWTRFQPGFLNRQIVTLLSSLDVEDDIFWNMQNLMISKLNKMVVDADVAFDVIMASCADLGHVAAIMLAAGFRPQTEPHLQGLLSAVRAAQFWALREKARIFVPSGRWLMGCFDELGLLEYGQCFIQVSTPSLESFFTKHGLRFSETKEKREIIQGLVVVAKNPCLHPGDIRILEAVDVSALHHLYDCLVFPQKGDRPHPHEASGSDLDGDLYFVTWDENLLPPSKKSWLPMEYNVVKAIDLHRQVIQKDIIDFFTRSMVNEPLGTICNAHVVHADVSEKGAMDDACLHLAELAAIAVDFPKTGKIVTMPYHLKPKKYPDFMGKEEFQSYRSTKILGKLYRQIHGMYNEDGETLSSDPDLNPTVDIHYDQDLEVPGACGYIEDAWGHKCSYDGQLRGLLEQYKVRKEEEVVMGHIWSLPRGTNSRKQGDLKERLKNSYRSLRDEFRAVFEKMEVLKVDDEERNGEYEQKASAWYQVTYHPEWVDKAAQMLEVDGQCVTPMLSFPWIAADYLARVKIRFRAVEIAGSSKPVDALARYVSDRI